MTPVAFSYFTKRLFTNRFESDQKQAKGDLNLISLVKKSQGTMKMFLGSLNRKNASHF